MKKFIQLLIVVVLVTSAHISHAKEPGEFTEDFFKMVIAGKISEAYDQLFVGSQIPVQKPQAVDMLKRQTSSGLPLYGSIVSLEKIREENRQINNSTCVCTKTGAGPNNMGVLFLQTEGKLVFC